MASRLNLHEELCEILGNRNVYFQPPESVKMVYPAIRYYRSGVDVKRADDRIYNTTNRYEVIVMDRDPDSDTADRILAHFQMCSLDRFFTAENLNHTVLTLYY